MSGYHGVRDDETMQLVHQHLVGVIMENNNWEPKHLLRGEQLYRETLTKDFEIMLSANDLDRSQLQCKQVAMLLGASEDEASEWEHSLARYMFLNNKCRELLGEITEEDFEKGIVEVEQSRLIDPRLKIFTQEDMDAAPISEPGTIYEVVFGGGPMPMYGVTQKGKLYKWRNNVIKVHSKTEDELLFVEVEPSEEKGGSS